MLSRTADSLFLMARYAERADFVARILDASTRLASLPQSYTGSGNEWESAVASAGNLDLFHSLYGSANEETTRKMASVQAHPCPSEPVLSNNLSSKIYSN